MYNKRPFDVHSPPVTRALGYVRVSVQSENGASMDAQRDAIEAECHRRHWHLVGLMADTASGGTVNGRPGLAHAVRLLDAGEADALVVAKLDRLSRSLLDFAALAERSRAAGWSLVALDLGVDTSTPSGEMMANVLAVFAQFERRLIGQRTRDALAVRRREGVRLGRPRTMPEEVRAWVITERKAGKSYRGIADELTAADVPTAHGGRRWHASTVRAAFRAR
jgi:DNA invertase Pin-like site-specific DNA recombinase